MVSLETDSLAVRRPVVLTIAGFDPSAGAGVTADLKVFAAFGIYGMACITALTVQSTTGVRAIEPVSAEVVAETLEMLADDVIFAGIKIGMLATGAVAAAVADFLDRHPGISVVLDPVLRSSSGRALLDADGVGVIRDRLLGRVDWMTPNWDELAVLSGTPIGSREEVQLAALRLLEMGAALGNRQLRVLVTGGEMERPEDYLAEPGVAGEWIGGERVQTTSTHGTGCALSSAVLCRLVRGDSALAAATQAKQYVASALRAAYPVGRGRGPMHHLFGLPGHNGK